MRGLIIQAPPHMLWEGLRPPHALLHSMQTPTPTFICEPSAYSTNSCFSAR